MSFIERPRETLFRRALFQLHLWLGLTVGLVTAVVALAGAVMVFRPELNRLTTPGETAVSVPPGARRQPAEDLLARVMARHPEHAFVNVYFDGGPERAWDFRTVSPEGEQWHTWVDPYTGRITATESYAEKPVQWVFEFHSDLLAGKPGRRVNGYFAIGLMAMALTGLVVWWPGRARWRFGFEFERRAGWKRQTYDLHKLAGFWSSGMLLMLAFTGAWFSFQELYMEVLGAPKAPRARTRIANRRVPLDEFIARAETQMPGARAVNVTVPAARGEALSVRLKEKADWHRLGQNYAYFEPATGELLRADRFAEQTTGTQFARLLTPFHFGRFGERFGVGMWPVWLTLVVYTGFGLMPPLLLVTGTVMNWNRVWAKRRRRGFGANPEW